jgi:hypothetical protein
LKELEKYKLREEQKNKNEWGEYIVSDKNPNMVKYYKEKMEDEQRRVVD